MTGSCGMGADKDSVPVAVAERGYMELSNAMVVTAAAS